MFRGNIWLTAILITAAIAGGAIYNWPSVSQPDAANDVTENLPESQSDPRGFSLSDLDEQDPEAPDQDRFSQQPLGNQVASETAPTEIDLLSDPQLSKPIAAGVPANDEKDKLDPLAPDPLESGDRYLQAGSFIRAYELYSKLAKANDASADGSLMIRVALAAELAGYIEQAETHYRDAIQARSSSPRIVAWSLLGTARIWAKQGRDNEAITLLSELMLSYGSAKYPTDYRLLVARCLADMLQQRVINLPNAENMASEFNAQKHFWCETSIEPVILGSSDFPADTKAEEKLTVIQRPIADAALILVDANYRFKPITRMLDELQSGARMRVQISDRARSIAAGRSLRADITATPVAVLLDLTLVPLGLVWRQDGEVISVLHKSEQREPLNERLLFARTARVLNQIQVNFTDENSARSAAFMHDGNLFARIGSIKEARLKYESARDLNPGGELSAKLYFNQALLELNQRNNAEALKLFYQSLDQTMTPELQALSYSRIAQLELRLARPKNAIPAASRGNRLAVDPEVSVQNMMILAKSYLLDSDPFSANRILFNNASKFEGSTKRFASVLATHARFQAMKPVSGLQNEGERLVLALASIRAEDLSSDVDHLLLSRAYFDAGLRSKAIEHLDIATKVVKNSSWTDRIRYELAVNRFETGDFAGASQSIDALSDDAHQELRSKAAVINAKSQLAVGNLPRCQAICESILRETTDVEQKKETLKILGQTYQADGKHYAAALCFAGLMPDPKATDE